jgi:hypothetical protein
MADSFEEIEITIDTEEIADFFFDNLLKFGYSPTEEELYDLADIMFEFLINKRIIAEEPDDDVL